MTVGVSFCRKDNSSEFSNHRSQTDQSSFFLPTSWATVSHFSLFSSSGNVIFLTWDVLLTNEDRNSKRVDLFRSFYILQLSFHFSLELQWDLRHSWPCYQRFTVNIFIFVCSTYLTIAPVCVSVPASVTAPPPVVECGARDVTDDNPVTDEDDTHSDKIPACPVQYSFYYCVYLTHSGRDKYWIFCPFVNQRLSLLKDKEIIENISLNTENWIISDCWFLVAQIFLFKLLSGNAQCFTKSSVWWQYARHLLFLPGNIGLTFFADFLLAAEEIHLHDFHCNYDFCSWELQK